MEEQIVAEDDGLGFRCRYPNNCNCCPPNKRAFDFVVTGLSVVERRRDELKFQLAELRAEVDRINAMAIHMNSGGRDPDEKCYSKRDVEALIAITLAVKAKHDSAPADSEKP